MMQDEIETEGTAMPVHMMGVNGIGSESSNDAFTVGLRLPWLQDTVEQNVWMSWNAEHFDLVILGPDNVEAAVHNLLQYDLADPANYEEIKGALVRIADRSMVAGGMYGADDVGMGPGHDMLGDGADVHPGRVDTPWEDAQGMHEDMFDHCPTDAPAAAAPMHMPAPQAHHQ